MLQEQLSSNMPSLENAHSICHKRAHLGKTSQKSLGNNRSKWLFPKHNLVLCRLSFGFVMEDE